MTVTRIMIAVTTMCVAALLHIVPAGAQSFTAQGFGAQTPGGAGKPIVRVTNLNDAGPGSFRAALSGGNRTIVFDVAGEIVLSSYLFVSGPFVTVDGFSAPKPGITLRNKGLAIRGSRGAHDVVVRGLRVRDATADGLQVAGAYNVLIEYCSVDSSGDGNLDITEKARDVTVAWNLLSGNVKNMLIKYGATRVTLHHNVFVDNGSRNPQVRMEEDTTVQATETTVDMRNNVIANWIGYGTLIWYGPWVNVVNNYYASSDDALQVLSARAYTAGNVTADGAKLDRKGTERVAFDAPFVETSDACTAAGTVLKRAGLRPLDDLDRMSLSRIAVNGCTGGAPPALTVDAMSLSFAAVSGTPDPAPIGVKVDASPSAALTFGAAVSTSDGGSWLRAATSGTVTPATVSVSVAPVGLAPGTYDGSVVVSSPGASSPPRTIMVRLTVEAPPPPAPVPVPIPGSGSTPGVVEVTGMWPVASAVDDGREDQLGELKTTTSILPVGNDGITGFRFAGVSIPRGAVIQSAVLYLFPISTTNKHISVRYLGERAGDSRPFGRAPGELSSRPKTGAFVDDRPEHWPRDEFYPSPELGAIVQEIVSQPQWRSGNSLTLFVADNGSPASRLVGSFESRPGSTRAAILVVTYR